MIEETQAIILRKQLFKENEVILTTYSEEKGRVDFVMYGATGKSKGRHMAFLQPLCLTRIIADFRPKQDLQVVRRISNQEPLMGLLTNPYKSTIALFLAEFLHHALRTNEQDRVLFLFLQESIRYLDLCDSSSIMNFHLAFLVRLSVFMGLTPNLGEQERLTDYFDLEESEYTHYRHASATLLSPPQQEYLRNLLRINYRNMGLFQLTREQRSDLLDRIITYYQSHIQGFGELKTLDVLHALFD